MSYVTKTGISIKYTKKCTNVPHVLTYFDCLTQYSVLLHIMWYSYL